MSETTNLKMQLPDGTDWADVETLNQNFQKVDAAMPGANVKETPADTDKVLLGDMMISLERAKAQAEEYGHSVEREICYLAVHSVLHLLGYDHLDEGPQKRQMRQREEAILGKLGIVRQADA